MNCCTPTEVCDCTPHTLNAIIGWGAAGAVQSYNNFATFALVSTFLRSDAPRHAVEQNRVEDSSRHAV